MLPGGQAAFEVEAYGSDGHLFGRTERVESDRDAGPSAD